MQRRKFIEGIAASVALFSIPAPLSNSLLADTYRPTTPLENTTQRLEHAIDEATKAYQHEQRVVDTYLDLRAQRLKKKGLPISTIQELHHPNLKDVKTRPKVRTGTLSPTETSFIADIHYYGKEIANKKRATRYDPTWAQEVLLRFAHLQGTDCTQYLLDAMRGVIDTTLLDQEYAKEPHDYTLFPWLFAMHLKEEFESIILVPDTKSKQRYYNGSRGGWTNRDLLRKLKNGQYYSSTDYASLPDDTRLDYLASLGVEQGAPVTDYAVLDDAVAKEGLFNQFLQQTPGLVAVHEFYHLLLLRQNELYEAHWGNNPLYANTFEKTDFLSRFTLPPDDPRRLHNALLWVPKGSVALFEDTHELSSSPFKKGILDELTRT